MPMGFCNPPVCWILTYNFAGTRIRVVDNTVAPPKNTNVPVAMFPNEAAAFRAKMNAMANVSCDQDCVCMRLHKNAVTVNYDPQYMCPHPNLANVDLYMTGITATGFFGLCLPKRGSIRIKKGDKWVYPEELPSTDILTPPSSPPGGSSGGSGSGKKKKGKKKPKKRRRQVRR